MSVLLTISNKALRKLGVQELESLTQQGKAAARCNNAVRDIVREVLREHPWSHATVWASLARKADSPPFGYNYAYQLPSEAERVIDIRQTSDLKAPLVNFETVSGKTVYTDVSPCYARFVRYLEADLVNASFDFIDACACRLAEEVAIPLAKSDLASTMHNSYLFAVDRARLNDASTKRERVQDENRTNSILAAREYPAAENGEEAY